MNVTEIKDRAVAKIKFIPSSSLKNRRKTRSNKKQIEPTIRKSNICLFKDLVTFSFIKLKFRIMVFS